MIVRNGNQIDVQQSVIKTLNELICEGKTNITFINIRDRINTELGVMIFTRQDVRRAIVSAISCSIKGNER